MADEEAELDPGERSDTSSALNALSTRLEDTVSALKNSHKSPAESESQYCYEFCQTLVEYIGLWSTEEEPLSLLEVYISALLSFAQASPYLSAQCEKVPDVLERLSLSCAELLISLPHNVPDELWDRFKSSVQAAHSLVQEKGISQLVMLNTITQEQGVWTNSTLQCILKNDMPSQEKVHEFLTLEGPALLRMRVKHLIKESCIEQAALLAKACAELSKFEDQGHFKQMYLVCLCTVAPQELVMEELSRVDCRDALEMICNLEADGDEKAAFTLCSVFLTRQILQEDSYCAWELTLFWGKLLKRLESSEQGFLDRCRQMTILSKTVFHLLFFVKVIQSEMDKVGLSACVDICIRALRMESCEGSTKATVCKTISCLLPTDLEVKRACQLTEFLLEPTVDSYYAVETLYNEADQKLEEEDLPVPNSLRCELLLVLKTQWPFDPEFWDWKTLKRHCLGLMGEEASIVCSIDELNDCDPEGPEEGIYCEEFKDVTQRFLDATNELNEIEDQRQKNREIKKLREKGFVSARFRNWQAYMQYCVLCDKEFLGHRIVRHAQTHLKDGCYTCPICVETFDARETLEPHVALHVKLSCKERLAAMKTTKKLANPKTAAPVIAALKAKSSEYQVRKIKSNCNGDSIFYGNANNSECLDLSDGNEGNNCPVHSCRKGFKYFRNLLAHVKDHGDNEEAKRFLEMQSTKVVCQYCRRHFVSVDHLNDHLQVHCGVKPYICIQLNCKASFDSNAELIIHKKDHPVFKAKCMFLGCGKIFHEAYKLYDHEAQHYQTFTCKAPDCGKVFHSMSELDVHAVGHVAKLEAQSTEVQIIQQTEPQPDLSNEMHQPAAVLATNRNGCSTGPQMDRGMVIVKHSVENMLKNAFAMSTQGCFHPGTSIPEQRAQSPIHQSIPQTNDQLTQSAMSPHLNQIRPEETLLDALMNDPDPMPSTSSYQSVLEDLLPAPPTDVLHGQLHTADSGKTPKFNNNNGLFGQYNPNPLNQNQTLYQSLYSKPITPSTQASHNETPLVSLGQMLPPISQTLPLQMAPLPTNGQVSENKSGQLVDVNSAVQVVKERHKCQFELCTRDYSSYRSVTKHMKAVHPEFYTQWKLAKKNKVAVPPTLRTVSINGSLNSAALPQNQLGQRVPGPVVQTQSPSCQPPPYLTNCANPSYPSVPSHIPASTGHTHNNEMANILDPIVLSQLGHTNQSQMTADHVWDPRNNSVLQKTCHSPGMTQNVNTLSSRHYAPHLKTASSEGAQHGGMSYTTLKPQNNPNIHPTPDQVDSIRKINNSTGDSLHSVANLNPAQQVMDPNMMGVVNSVTETNLGSTLMPVLPFYTDSLDSKVSSVSPYTQQISSLNSSVPKDSPASACPQQINNNSFSAKTHAQFVVKLETKPSIGLPLPNNGTPPSNMSSPATQNTTGIVFRDGDNKKVKRSRRTKWPAIIKDGKFICCRCYREFQSSKSLGGHLSKRASCKTLEETDLTADLPSSFLDLLNAPHPTTSSLVELEPSVHLPNKGPLDPKLYPNVTFPQANNSTYTSNDKPTAGEFQLDPSNLCVSSGQDQQPVSNTCGPYAQNRLSETSVIQHTCSVKTPPQASYTEMSNPLFNDPLLSQLFAEDHSTSTQNSGSSDHVSQILQAETLNKMKEIKEKTAIINASGLSNEGLLAAMATLAQNLVSEKSVKERLREQILAGDLHKKCLPAGSSLDSSCSQMSVASPLTVDPQHPSNVIQSAPPSEQRPVGNTAGTSTEAILQLGNISPNEASLHTQSSVSSGSAQNDQPNDTIITTVDEVLEIQKALEKLNLDREINEDTRTVDDPTRNDRQPNKFNVSPFEIPSFIKPFACDTNGCTYRAMTKDAFFKHLIKLHNYSDDMLTQFKDQFNVAPFSCHKCTKAFTRNSNLKVHYQTVHNFTKEDVKKMKNKRQSNHRLLESDRGSSYPVPELPNPVKNTSLLDARQQQIDVPGASESNVKISHYITPTFDQKSAEMPEVRGLALGIQTETLQNHTPVQPSVIVSGYSSVTPSIDQQPNAWFSTKSSFSGQIHGFPLKELLPMPSFNPNPSAPVQVAIESLDKNPKPAKPRVARLRESPKKPKDRKAEAEETFSPYRPYRCVHQGCVAAFTIQHNLILHYKAVHQSALPKFEDNNQDEQSEEEAEEKDINQESEDKLQGDVKEVDEIRCQVKDCSCIFQSVPDLLQHYLLLHKLTIEKAGAMMCSINLGRFQCDQPECSETFTAFWKYISHVDQEHTGTTISQVEPVEGMFRCQVKGCKCAYSTRSNLLRHTMKKHQDIYKRMLMNPKEGKRGIKLGRPKKCHLDVIEKENRETNKKSVENEKSSKKPVKKAEKENQENKKKPVQRGEKENREKNKKPVQKCEKENRETNKKPVKNGEKENRETNKKPVQKREKENRETNKKPVQKREKENRETNKKPVQKREKENRETNKKPVQKREKENRDTNKKPIQKDGLKKREKKNNWKKYGKPLLKTQEEAAAMCTKRLQLQYACMIKGCETVTSSERNIMKHYLQHGLPKQYLEEQRSNFIYCKKIPRSRYKRIASRSNDTDKSEESSISETSDNEEVVVPIPSESEFSKATSEKESTEDPDLSDCKPSTDTCSEVSVVVKRKRGRPRKGEGKRDKSFGHKRTTRLRTARSCTVNYADLNSESTSSSTTMTQEDIFDQNTPLNSFKPMGFEVSFLQFLQESRTSQKRKATVPLSGCSRKRTTIHLKTATVVCKRSDVKMHSREVLQLVEFKNPQKLSSLSNVTFEVQKVFSDVFGVLLKQLHEMQPTVILQKDD
ncbi:zinc finger protein 292-like [Xyrauchen texanus]|uniref:zinc finger protein 292-like n=1 Tax=Xyrauchen texanus TaxID=154827 RepID=UPI002241EAB0|nr:zinc finger protein 292-like [Xyrauchen texanus]